MITKLEHVNENTLNIIIYSSSPTLDLMARDILRKRFTKDRECVIDTFNAKELGVAKANSMVSPLSGGKWLIHVNTEKFTFKELIKAVNTNSSYGITVYWTTKYKVYKDLINLEVIKNMNSHCASYYFGRIDDYGVTWLYNKMLGEGSTYLNKELLSFVAKNYAYEVEDICELFRLLKVGYVVESKKDIMSLIGIGNNSIENIALYLLTSTTTTDKGKATLSKKILKRLDDLVGVVGMDSDKRDRESNKLCSYMLSFLDGCIEIKQLQMMGYYAGHGKDIPASFNEKRILRLRRYSRRILDDVSLSRVLNLKLALKKYNNHGELALIQGILEYIGTLGNY